MAAVTGIALAAYLALWAVLAAGIVYATVRAGYSAWVGAAFALLLFVFVNGSLAYRARARQLRREGKTPPPYFQYLFLPQGFPRFKEEASRSGHFFVGIAAALTGLFLVFCGIALAFDADWSRISQPILAASLCVVLAGVGASFLYLAWRLVGFRARGLVGDVTLVLGFLVLLSARIADDWWWFAGIFAAGLVLVVLSLVAVPFESHVSWMGRAPLKDPSHELNIAPTKDNTK